MLLGTCLQNVEENVEKNVEENVEENDKEPTKKTITAKPVKERKRKLAFEVPQEEKARCEKGKWTYNYQGGETFCVDGYSYTINNHTISKKTGGLSLYLICTKCGGRNILTNGKLKKDDHPGHTCSPDPDNWTILEADLRLICTKVIYVGKSLNVIIVINIYTSQQNPAMYRQI